MTSKPEDYLNETCFSSLPFLICTCIGVSQDFTTIHAFQYWGTLQTPVEKMIFLNGFTNGFFAGPRTSAFLSFDECLENNLTTVQAIAMVDKYYKENPEKWNLPLGNGIVLALIVKGGPCAGKDPWK